jgi:hypothetical protein
MSDVDWYSKEGDGGTNGTRGRRDEEDYADPPLLDRDVRFYLHPFSDRAWEASHDRSWLFADDDVDGSICRSSPATTMPPSTLSV